jgi:hypothetical protein
VGWKNDGLINDKCINIEFLDMLKREMMYHDIALFEDLGDNSIPSTG